MVLRGRSRAIFGERCLQNAIGEGDSTGEGLRFGLVDSVGIVGDRSGGECVCQKTGSRFASGSDTFIRGQKA